MITAVETSRALSVLACVLLIASCFGAAFAKRATVDPQSSLLEAERAIATGDVETAGTHVARIRKKIESDPRWDPDGAYTRAYLPAIEQRIARMRGALEKLAALPGRLEAFEEGSGIDEDPADPASDLERSERQSVWVMDQLRQIVSGIPAGPDRGALIQSTGYAAAVDLIVEKILPETAEAVRERFAQLDRGDERVRAVKARMDSLKREVIDGAVEREQLEMQLDAVRANQEAYRRVLIEFIGDDPQTARQPASTGLQGIGLALARRIREVWTEVRKLERHSPADHARLLHEIECLRLANRASIADGSRDLGARIDALAVAVNELPVSLEGGADQLAGATGCMAALRP